MSGSAAAPAPRIDLHGHAGRCFLAGLDDSDRFVAMLGGAGIEAAADAARRAGMTAFAVATVADLAVLRPDPSRGLRADRDFAPGEAYTDHLRQLRAVRQALVAAGVKIVATAEAVQRAWHQRDTVALLGCEGADFLERDLGRLAEAAGYGMWSLTLVHYRVNDIGDVQTEPPVHHGLSALGHEVVAECNRLQLVIDCAHASLATTAAVAEASAAPVMISHSHLQPADGQHPRLLSSAHASVVAEAGGLIGAWPAGVTSATLADFADEIARLVDVVGVEHVGLGTDLDGNYRPVLTDYSQLNDLHRALGTLGMVEDEINKIFGGNALELLRRVRG